MNFLQSKQFKKELSKFDKKIKIKVQEKLDLFLGNSNHTLLKTFAVVLPLGHAIGRLGCLAAGCCYGRHTDLPWGVAMDGDPSRHPTQLYEAILNGLIAFAVARVGLARTRDGRWLPGSALLLYIALYAVARFVVEIFRGDDRGAYMLGLSPSQFVAVAALLGAGSVALARRRTS